MQLSPEELSILESKMKIGEETAGEEQDAEGWMEPTEEEIKEYQKLEEKEAAQQDDLISKTKQTANIVKRVQTKGPVTVADIHHASEKAGQDVLNDTLRDEEPAKGPLWYDHKGQPQYKPFDAPSPGDLASRPSKKAAIGQLTGGIKMYTEFQMEEKDLREIFTRSRGPGGVLFLNIKFLFDSLKNRGRPECEQSEFLRGLASYPFPNSSKV